MDGWGEIIVWVLGLIAIVIGVTIYVTVFLAIAGACAIFAIIFGVGEGIKNFFTALEDAHKTAYNRPPGDIKAPLISRLYEPQPANLIYFLGAGWFVMGYTSREVWIPTKNGVNVWFAEADRWQANSAGKGFPEEDIVRAAAWGLRIGTLTYFPSAFIIVALFVVLQVIALILGTIITSIPIAIISAVTWLYGRINRIYYRCPHCHHQMAIPTHVCPDCSTEHSRLWPSVYGVLHHRCRGGLHEDCNAWLPTIGFIGRNKLTQICPNCSRHVEGLGGTNIHIPIIGGTGAGKSHYIAMATKQFIEDYAPDHGITTAIVDAQHLHDYESKVALLNRGERLIKTDDSEDSPEAYNIRLKMSRLGVPKLMYIYDAAGEHYGDDGRAMKQVYLKYTHGVILIIDPFAIEQVSREYADELRSTTNQIAPSHKKPDEIFATMTTTLEYGLEIKPGRQVKQPIAVVIVKSDAFDLEDRIGEPAARKLMDENPTIKHTGDAINLLVEQFFRDVGETNFVNSLRGTFSTVRFFSCSSVGLDGIGNDAPSFDGVRVLDPLLWLLGQTHHLPANRGRIREVDEYDLSYAKAEYPHKLDYWRYYLWESLKPIDKSDIKRDVAQGAIMNPHETSDGSDQHQAEQEHPVRLREAMRPERYGHVSDVNTTEPSREGERGDRPPSRELLEHVGQHEKLAPYGKSQHDEGATGHYDCAVVAQQNSLEALGVESTTEEIRQMGEKMTPPAYGRGEHNPLKGSTPSELGYAFEEKGVGRMPYTSPNETGEIFNEKGEVVDRVTPPVEHLRNELSDGKAVIVAVEVEPLWKNQTGGHALWVTDAAFTPDGKLDHVHVNDSGQPSGQNQDVVYDGKDFMEAWERQNFRTASSKAKFPF